jgi:hypothetical protein
MAEHHAGMIVRQKAIDWWPYIGTIIDRINEAAEEMNIEALDETFLDVANLVKKRRKVTTVEELNAELNKELRWYKRGVRDIVVKKKALKTGIGVRGKPVREITLKQYQSEVNGWTRKRDKQKEEIQKLVKTIKAFSPHGGQIVVRGKVPLKVFIGGKYPARLTVKYEQGHGPCGL